MRSQTACEASIEEPSGSLSSTRISGRSDGGKNSCLMNVIMKSERKNTPAVAMSTTLRCVRKMVSTLRNHV